MKKNLFLLFSLYFFVIQGLIVWILRWDDKFFRLAAINLVCIVLIASSYKLFGKEEKSESKPNNEPKRNEFVEHKHVHIWGKKQGLSNKTRNFIISLAIALIIYLQLLSGSEWYGILLIAVAGWFVAFILLNIFFKSNENKTRKQWRMSILYVFLLAISLWLWIYGFMANDESNPEPIDNDDKIVTSGTVLESWMNVIDEMINSWTTTTGTVIKTGTVAVQTGTTPTPTTAPTAGESLKIIDALKYLFKEYNIPTSTKTDVSFTYVAKSDAIYPIYRAAYERRMIGKSTNPTKMILCDSYIVMKWLLEKWNVAYNATNVTTQFRNEAVTRWLLNGCQKGKTVKEANL